MNQHSQSQFEKAIELYAAMNAEGVSHNPYFRDMWEWGRSPLGKGRHAARFQARLENALAMRGLERQLERLTNPSWPGGNSGRSFMFGFEFGSNQPVAVDLDVLVRHSLIVGSSGVGKTTLMARLISCLAENDIRVVFQDHKGEGRRFLNIYRDGIAVFRPDQEPWNMLEPVGQSEIYWSAWTSEFAKAYTLRPETWTELTEILKRLERGKRPDDPYPSLKDFERILFALAEKEKRPKLETAARALASLNALLGRTAHIRKAPEVVGRYKGTILESQGLPPRLDAFLCAVRLLRTQMHSTSEGHDAPTLKQMFVLDEGAMAFGKELSQSAGSGYISPFKRSITQIRSTGTGIAAGVQIVSDIDDSLKANAATVICLRCSNPKDAREAAQIIGLLEQASAELQTLPIGVGYIRSEGFNAPVKIRLPNFDIGPYPGNEEVAKRMAPEFSWLGENTLYSPERPDETVPLSYLDVLGENVSITAEPEESAQKPLSPEDQAHFLDEHRALLSEIESHRDLSTTEHYRNLNWSAGRGNRVKDQLLALALIESQRQKSANGRPKEILVLTAKGRAVLHETS